MGQPHAQRMSVTQMIVATPVQQRGPEEYGISPTGLE